MTAAAVLADREALRPTYRALVRSGRRTVYVAASGSDSAAGTQAAPYATIQHAIDTAQPGDRILVGTGVWGYTQLYGTQGNATAWVSIEALPGATPVIDVSGATHASGDGMDIQLAAYIGVFGLEVRASQTQSNSDASGIGVFRGSHHIVTWCNDVHDFPGGGINHFYIGQDTSYTPPLPSGGWDMVDCSFNTIHACCKYSKYNTSGVSFYGAQDITKTTWSGSYAYRSVGNYIFDCICTVAYSPGGFTDVTDGNGISVDSLAVANNLYPDLPAYTKRGLLEANIIAACGGRAVHTYNSINLDCLNNTAVGNLRTNSPYINGSVEFDLQLDTSFPDPQVLYRGNVIAPLNTANSTDADATNTANVILGGTQAVPAGNVDRRSTGLAYFTGALTPAALVAGAPLASFVPVAVDAVARPTQRVQGRQALGRGWRPGRAAWAAGALEAPLAMRYATRS